MPLFNNIINIKTLFCLVLCGFLISCGNDKTTPEEIVIPPQVPNILPTANAGIDLTVTSGQLVELSGKASQDSDGNIAEYLWQQTSGTTVLINSTNQDSDITFIAPNTENEMILEFSLSVLDNQNAQAVDTVLITIIPSSSANILPYANAGEDVIANSEATVSLSGIASYDSDGTIEQFLWQQTSGQTVTLLDGDKREATFVAPKVTQTSILSFELTVTDNQGGESNDNMSVTLSPENNNSRLSTTITLQADSEIIPFNNELVTFALPLPQGIISSTDKINVAINGIEQPIYIEKGLMWHWSDNSLRSITIQLQNVDMSQGNKILTITDKGRNTNTDLTEQPQANGWATAGANKANMQYPRIFALHDKKYLATTGLISPYLSAPDIKDSFEEFQQGQFEKWSGNLNFKSSSGANWLFDRSSAYFKIYMTTGKVEYLKEAFLSKQFYFSHVRNDNSSPAKAGGRGCWTWGSVACADGKYISPQPAKLAWALTGDNSQWDNSLIIDMALQSDLGWNQYASRDLFDKENEGFTERGAGMAGLAEIAAYEITADSTILAHLNERIASLKDMQQTEKSWDKINNWIPKSGGFEHNLDVHEGNHNENSAPLGDSNSRGFSSWMSENIADFLWQSYWITGNDKIPEMLKRLGNAVDLYGFTSTYNAVTKKHDTKAEFAAIGQIRTKSCNLAKKETDLLYLTSVWANASTRTSGDYWPYYSDTHNIETVLILASAYYFETNNVNQQRLKARIDKLISGWGHKGCSSVFSNVHRLFNWQHRSNSIRSWYWIEQKISSSAIITPVIDPQANTSVSFQDMTSDVINVGPIAHQPFWIGMPDVNNDGCVDLFVGTHNDNLGTSQMWLHDVINKKCSNKFSHYNNSQANYSQKQGGRITSRYVFSNITGKTNGLPDFFGSDADGGNSVIYPLSPSINIGEEPQYTTELSGCRGGKARCVALDINGDGTIELLTSSSIGAPKRRIYDPLSNVTIVPELNDDTEAGYASTAYLIMDVDNDSWPDVVSGERYGYWRYNPKSKTFDEFVVAFNDSKENLYRSCRGLAGNFQVSIDYDNDGDFDVLFGGGQWSPKCKDKEFYLSLHRNNGDGSFTDVTATAGGKSWTDGSLKNQNNWTTYGGIYPGDFNNDGHIDFMTMTQSYGNSPRLFQNNGDGTFSTIRNLIVNGGAGVDMFRPWGNIGDWNNDGFLDVAILSNGVANVEGLKLYKNNGNDNHWLKIRARGLGKNTDGYHTKFIVKNSSNGAILATRYLGNFNQADARFIAHAGLGSSEKVDLTVEFPHGGPVYRYANLSVDRELVVFRDGCLIDNWQPGQGWPTTSVGQNCLTPDE